jgi:copper homeostasis protein CutC
LRIFGKASSSSNPAPQRASANAEAQTLLERAVSETGDSIRVLEGGGLHPEAVAHLKKAKGLAEKAACSLFKRRSLTKRAIEEQASARRQLVGSS